MSTFVRLSITRVTHEGHRDFFGFLGCRSGRGGAGCGIVGRDRNDRLSNDLTVRTGAPTAIFSPAAYPFVRQKTQHVIYQGFGDGSGDGQVHELWWDGHWQHNNLTSQTDAPLIAGEPWGLRVRRPARRFDPACRLPGFGARLGPGWAGSGALVG